jgi:uncharacterized RDD family membrane protein YckC
MALGDIILLKNQTPLGPFTRAQIQEGMSRGEFRAEDLAHTPGLKDWLPLEEVLHHLDHDVVKAPRRAGERMLPPVPGTPIAIEPAPVSTSPGIPPALEHRPPPLEKTSLPPDLASAMAARIENGLTPAPMSARMLAWIIDWAVLFVPIFVLYGFALTVTTAQAAYEHTDAETLHQQRALLDRNLQDLLLLVAIGFGWIYGAGLECSRWQATVGKQWMGIVVTDGTGQRLHFLQASKRHAAKYLSALPLFAGFMAALFNPRRLAWHDRLAHTRVVAK